jgi:hypothetical protein
MSCFYCDSRTHASYGCPTRAISGAEKEISAQIATRAKRDEKALERLGQAMVSEISSLSAQVEGLADSVAALHNTLHIGFSEVIRELHLMYNLMAEVLPHPVVTEARDLYQIGVRMLRRGFHQEAERKLLEAKDRDPYAPG